MTSDSAIIASPYPFEPRFPLDHVLSLVRLIRSGETGSGRVLTLVGAITGELGALLGNGPIFSVESTDEAMTLEEACDQLAGLEFRAETALPTFDPTPWIPVILLIIELILKRRQQK